MSPGLVRESSSAAGSILPRAAATAIGSRLRGIPEIDGSHSYSVESSVTRCISHPG